MIVTKDPEVYCDICGKKIQPSPFADFLCGNRYMVRTGIFSIPRHADFCDECIEKIRSARFALEKKTGGVKCA